MQNPDPSTRRQWECRGRRVDVSRPVVMGILNTTPDSFSDGGQYDTLEAAVARGSRMVAEGAVIVDVGGESTRPGFTPVDVEEESRRTLPVVRALRAAHPGLLISIDTRKAAVAVAALEAGAEIVNDVSGLADPRMAEVVRASGAGLVLMHGYAAHVGEHHAVALAGIGTWVTAGLRRLLDEACAAGIPAERLVVDPGFGFGKRHAENGAVLRAVPAIAAACGRPVLIAGSRKHFVNGLFPETGDDPVAASVAFAREARRRGGSLFRVHDVVETCSALGIALQ